jgi:4-hydroxy-tetrahydrodipicolinate synthase|tara:strand:- start:1941 stop:2834 length:894 start_codon:yes stop_codon:yes gene_type:complete
MMQALHGSLVALVTPMNSKGDIDFNSLEKLIEWHIANDTNGIVSVGTTGESATLTVDEHLKVIEHTVKCVNGRIPVIAGSGSNSTAQAIETTTESHRIGADFSLLVTPYYNRPNQKGLIEHYIKIADECNINQILYNVPSRTGCDILPETVEVLSKHQNIIGIKEAVNNQKRINELVKISKQSREDFLIFSGDDESFFNLITSGGHGVISVAANVIPKSISDICKLIIEEKIEEANEINKKYQNLYDLLFIESNPIPVKWILFKMGFIQNSLRLPLVNLDKKFEENIMSEMIKLKLL